MRSIDRTGQELIDNGRNGFLVDFFDIDAWVDRVLEVLHGPASFGPVREAARKTIADTYSLPKCLDQILELYREIGVG